MDVFLNFLKTYGIWGLLICIVAFGLTEAIKYPLKKLAKKYEQKTGEDKIVITKWFSFIPLILTFIGSILNVWANAGWGNAITLPEFNWTDVIVETIACTAISGSVYNIIENFQKSALEKKITALTAESSSEVANAKATIAAATITEADKAKAEEEAKKAEVKAQKLKEKAEKEAKKKADEIAKLQAKVDMLKASTTATTNETISVVSNSSANDGMIATR